MSKHILSLHIVGSGDDVQRLQKRLRCAAGALGVTLQVQVEGDDLDAVSRGARRGPLVLAGEQVIADGLLPVEELQTRLAELTQELLQKER